MFYFYTFIYSLKICFKPQFPSSAKHKRYFEEGGKPNSCWSTVFPTVKVNVDQQLFGYPHSSKYRLTDVNVCGARTAADRMCAVARCNNISSKADRGDIFISVAAGQMGAISRILLLCPLPQILWK